MIPRIKSYYDWIYPNYAPEQHLVNDQLRRAVQRYDHLGYFLMGVAQAERNGRKYIINTQGEEILENSYDDMHFDISGGLINVIKDGLNGFCDLEGREVIAPTLDYVGVFCDGLAPFGVGKYPNRKYGYINTQGEVVVPPIYDWADWFCDGRARVGMVNPEYGRVYDEKYMLGGIVAEVPREQGFQWVLNTKGEKVFEVPYTGIYDTVDEHFRGGRLRIRHNSKYGLLDQDGNEAVPFIYSWLGNIYEGVAPFSRDSHEERPHYEMYEVQDSYGNTMQRWQRTMRDEISTIRGLVDADGNEVMTLPYRYIDGFEDGMSLVTRRCNINGTSKELMGFIDHSGNEVVETIYDKVHNYSEGRACVHRKHNGHKVSLVINREGEAVMDLTQFSSHGLRYADGMIDIAITDSETGEKRFGFADRMGRIAIPPKYDQVDDFSEGLAVVKRNGCYGYVDKVGNDTF
ncbi:MAG: WG repeat-containing protein [Bacteroidales bacterium]|nr:WG repeat-containing protein [Bacteroidales bacterium]